MVISHAWKILDERRDRSVRRDFQNASPEELCDIKGPLMVDRAVPRTVLLARSDHSESPAGVDPQQAGSGPDLAVGVARLHHIDPAVRVERDAGWKGQLGGGSIRYPFGRATSEEEIVLGG